MRMRPLIVLALALALVVPAQPAPAQSGYDLVEACLDGGGSEAMCRGLYQLLRVPGGACRDVAADSPECAFFDGITIEEALVLAHESSWLNQALALQRGLDDRRPLVDELWAHTHNSYNADAYGPQILGGLDRNHIYNVRDQLRMGIRAIELDLHYFMHPTSVSPRAVQVCHGNTGTVPPLPNGPYHLGCELGSPLLGPHLAEIRTWMDANPGEVLMLYLENQMENDPDAHAEAAATINQHLGDLTYRPGSPCASLPMDTSREQIRSSGARVIITGNAGPGAWCDWVHERGPRWREGGLGYGNDFPAFPCTERRAAHDYPNNWIRHWGDETGVSASMGTGGDVTSADATNMTNCGVNMIGFDNLVPFDERLAGLVWSWRTDEPSTDADGYCAAHGEDERFYAADCTVKKKVVKIKRKNRPPVRRVVKRFHAAPFACFDGSDWHVTAQAERFSRGQATCRAERLGDFAVPWNGYEHERFKLAKGQATDVWLNYKASGGRWIS